MVKSNKNAIKKSSSKKDVTKKGVSKKANKKVSYFDNPAVKYGLIALGVVILIIVFSVFFKGNSSECSDGTLVGECSLNKPYFCLEGSLVERASVCGCPDGYSVKGEECKQTCDDGTIYGECSSTGSLYCLNGTLIESPSVCGCDEGELYHEGRCISLFQLGEETRIYKYLFTGTQKKLKTTVYLGMKKYLENLRSSCVNCPFDEERVIELTSQEEQTEALEKIIESIKESSISVFEDHYVRIAISMVQNIPSVKGENKRYPYEVLYDNEGTDKEKALLTASLIKKLGYGVVIFDFEEEDHFAVGIKCPLQYSYGGSGYCFIEPAMNSIITDDTIEYDFGTLKSTPKIIKIPSGTKSFDSVDIEYNDKLEWIRTNEILRTEGSFKYSEDQKIWQRLKDKYGLS